MSKEQIETILDANTYLIKCKCESGCRKKYNYARKYLNLTVQKVLFKPKKSKSLSLLLSIFFIVVSIFD